MARIKSRWADLDQRAIAAGYRSGLEHKVAKELTSLGVTYTFEEYRVGYTKPERVHYFKPDFILPNGIIIETKGQFVTSDRQKHILISEQHPNLDIRFVFSNPNQRISKVSKTTYAKWCETHGFQYATTSIPINWINEPATSARLEANAAVLKQAKAKDK